MFVRQRLNAVSEDVSVKERESYILSGGFTPAGREKQRYGLSRVKILPGIRDFNETKVHQIPKDCSGNSPYISSNIVILHFTFKLAFIVRGGLNRKPPSL